MRKAIMRTFGVLVFFAMLFSSAIPALAEGTEVGTDVSIAIKGFEITSCTEDFTMPVGDSQQLKVTASQQVITYVWHISTDNGLTWKTAPGATNAATYDITDAKENSPAEQPYKYRVTVTNVSGVTDSAIISVLVSNDYDYRTISLRQGDTDVSGYMHDDTRLVVKDLYYSSSGNSAAVTALTDELSPGCLPLLICDVSLINQDDQVVPYFGALQVDFHVGSTYDGMALNVYHLTGGNIVTYTGVVGAVTSGVLSIVVNNLSPFMVEAPTANTHTVTVSAGTGGSVSPSGTVNVADGADKTFTFLPDAGYAVSTVKVDGATVNITGNSYTLIDVTRNHTLAVSFSQVTPSGEVHKVSISAGPHGSVYPSGDVQVYHGSALTVYFYPDDGYELDKVQVNGVDMTVIGNCYTLSAVDADIRLHATFRTAATQLPNIYKAIHPSAGIGGRISPSDQINVEYGGEMFCYFIPDSGYEVDQVTVDGTEVSVSGNSYHFVNVIDEHTIHVTFKQKVTPPQPPQPPQPPSPITYHTIVAGSGRHGSISPSGSILVAAGGAQAFFFLPDEGYEVDSVLVDGLSVIAPGDFYRFSSVTSGHTISVTFKRSAALMGSTVYHTVTASSGANGSISPEGRVRVAEDHNATFYFIPDEGYAVDTVTIDGSISAPPSSTYNFTAVDEEHTVHVTFRESATPYEPVTFHTVTVSIEGNGRISPSGDVQVADGGSQTFYFMPDNGYKVLAIYVDGEKQDVVGSRFTLDHITNNMEIRAVFEPVIAPAAAATAAQDDTSHCFICKRSGQNIAPWCWLIPLMVTAVFAGAGAFLCIRYRKKR